MVRCMKFVRKLSILNIGRKKGRSAALIALTAFLALFVFGGSLIVLSLQNGLKSYKDRLGADIIVIPNESRSKGMLDSILLQGIPGYFYMDADVLGKVRQTEGVEIASPQFYLASASAGCCSVAVQIIGFDPENDFTIKPWIRKSYSGEIKDGDIIVGSNITIPADRRLSFYNTECNVAAQLQRTGTGLDNAVYANMNTIKRMMKNAKDLGFNYFDDVDVNRAISSIMVKVEEGYDIEHVTGEINVHVRRAQANMSKNMISGIAGGLNHVSRLIGVLVVLVWLLSGVILLISFITIMNERMKEFVVLRTMGASMRMIKNLIRTESLYINLTGGTIGVLLGAMIVIPFGSLIQSKLELPYLMPKVPVILLIAVGTFLLSVAAALLTSVVCTEKISKNETGLLLRDA